MVFLNGVSKPRPHDMGINLGSRNIGVTQHDLHTAQIGATLEEVSGKAVTEHMGRQPVKYAGFLAVGRQEFPEPLPGHASAARGYEKVFTGAALEQAGSAALEVGPDCQDGSLSDWHQALLIALSRSAEDAQFQVQIAHPDLAQFAYP
jgi:hypothetical protein